MTVFSATNEALAKASTNLANAGVSLATTFDRLKADDPSDPPLVVLGAILRHVASAGYLTDSVIKANDGLVPDHSEQLAAVTLPAGRGR